MFQQQNCLNICLSFTTNISGLIHGKYHTQQRKLRRAGRRQLLSLHPAMGSQETSDQGCFFYFSLTFWVCSFLQRAEGQSLVLKVNLRNQSVHPPPDWKLNIIMDREPVSKAKGGRGSLTFLGRQEAFLLALILADMFQSQVTVVLRVLQRVTAT